ncbi:MAG: succinyl-CoA synthetase beta subunit [Verrucomicrobiota bacterium]|jgi:succinyl-CoA synthetase beta subunit
MVIHEYQARSLFKAYGIPVTEGVTVESVQGLEAKLKELAALYPKAQHPDVDGFVVKAQVHAGGRGKGDVFNAKGEQLDRDGKKLAKDGKKAGGVLFRPSIEGAVGFTEVLLGKTLVTKQTGEAGVKINKVLVVPGLNIAKEYYLAIVMDRKGQCPFIIASSEGGMDIEEVAEHHPEKVAKIAINPASGWWPVYGRRVASALGLTGDDAKKVSAIAEKLYKLFLEKDASIVEVNPLVKTDAGNYYAIDGKLNFDDNALFRQPEIAAMRDKEEENPLEVEATEADLNYVKLDGSIGCMVNGAGLAMATMDTIKLYGGEPANFLDVGGTANAERVEKAFRILMKDPKVKVVLINVFGGIVLCDRVANGVVEAVNKIPGFKMPVVVRLAGTNSELAKDILKKSGLKLIPADDLNDGAKKAVAAAAKA